MQSELKSYAYTLSEDYSESYALGFNVVRLRKRCRMKKIELARALGISRPLLDKLEAGEYDARLSLLHDISEFFDVEIDDLLTLPCMPDAKIGSDAINKAGGL